LKETDNPFDNILFWLDLAFADFSFGFEETGERENIENDLIADNEKKKIYNVGRKLSRR
jgi:hypothetical protein